MKILVSSLSLLTLLAFAAIAQAADTYPLQTCVVSGEQLGGEMGKPVVINYQGTEVRFCCNSCIKNFNADPAKYLAKLKAAQTAAK
jgi:hypothetical protein